MQGTTPSLQGGVKASPPVHRAKKCGPRVARFASSPLEVSLQGPTGRRFCGVLGLQRMQEPGQNASAHLPHQRAKVPLQCCPLRGRRLVGEALLQQTHPRGA